MDAATKIQILLRLGHTKTPVVMDDTSPQSIALAKLPPGLQSRHVIPRVQTTEHPKEEHRSEGDATKMVRDFSSRRHVSYFLGSWLRLPDPY